MMTDVSNLKINDHWNVCRKRLYNLTGVTKIENN